MGGNLSRSVRLRGALAVVVEVEDAPGAGLDASERDLEAELGLVLVALDGDGLQHVAGEAGAIVAAILLVDEGDDGALEGEGVGGADAGGLARPSLYADARGRPAFRRCARGERRGEGEGEEQGEATHDQMCGTPSKVGSTLSTCQVPGAVSVMKIPNPCSTDWSRW